jgi:hypothetical protein
MGRWVHGWVGSWVGGLVSGLVGGWLRLLGGLMDQWVDGLASKWVYQLAVGSGESRAQRSKSVIACEKVYRRSTKRCV